ncbi:hypothetical protein J6590_060135 [Homalodisca vitripennis]|nr:hypothetical protein J6590_060135 [Homalodisca vitripennis]
MCCSSPATAHSSIKMSSPSEKLVNAIMTSVCQFIDESGKSDGGVRPHNGRHCPTCRCFIVRTTKPTVAIVHPYRPETPPNEDRVESPPLSPDESADEYDDQYISDDEEAAVRRDEALREAALQDPRPPSESSRTSQSGSPQYSAVSPEYSPASPVPTTVQSPSVPEKTESRKRPLRPSCSPRIYSITDTSSDDEEDDGRPQTRRRFVHESQHPSRNRPSADGAGHSRWT